MNCPSPVAIISLLRALGAGTTTVLAIVLTTAAIVLSAGRNIGRRLTIFFYYDDSLVTLRESVASVFIANTEYKLRSFKGNVNGLLHLCL